MKTGLLLVDLQRDFLQPDGRLAVGEKEAAQVLRCVNRLLASAADRNLHPVFIVNQFSPTDRLGNFLRKNSAIRGSAGAEIDPRVTAAGWPVFSKQQSNAFSNPELGAHLKAQEISRVVIVGVMTEACVRATANAAIRLGYPVTVLLDGVASDSAWRHRFGLWAMRRSGAKIQTSDEFLNYRTLEIVKRRAIFKR